MDGQTDGRTYTCTDGQTEEQGESSINHPPPPPHTHTLCLWGYNEQAAHVKIDCDSVSIDLGHSNSLISPVVGWFSTTGVL